MSDPRMPTPFASPGRAGSEPAAEREALAEGAAREPIPLNPAARLESAAEPGPGAEPVGPLDEGAPAPQGEEQALRVARLRAQVAAGTYHPTAEEIARAMVDHAAR